MLIYESGFSEAQLGQLGVAVRLINDALRSTNNFPKNLQRDLEGLLAGQDPSPTMAIAPYAVIAYDPRTDGPWGYTGGACVWLTGRVFDPEGDRLPAVLLHELVHVLCGNELDSEVSESYLFSKKGATLPDPGDLTSFRQANWRGRWFRLIRRSSDGKVVARHDWGDIEFQIPRSLIDLSDVPTE